MLWSCTRLKPYWTHIIAVSWTGSGCRPQDLVTGGCNLTEGELKHEAFCVTSSNDCQEVYSEGLED